MFCNSYTNLHHAIGAGKVIPLFLPLSPRFKGFLSLLLLNTDTMRRQNKKAVEKSTVLCKQLLDADYTYIDTGGLLSALLGRCIAFAAVYRSVVGRLERYLGFLATLRANCCKELSGSLARILSCISAGLASLRLVLESALRIKLLLTGGEHEFGTAVLTNQFLVFVHAVFTSLE